RGDGRTPTFRRANTASTTSRLRVPTRALLPVRRRSRAGNGRAMVWGPDIDALRIAFGGVLASLLLALASSDARTMLLPDRLNLLLAGGGLGQNLIIGLPGLRDALLGSVIGGVLLGLLATAFRRLRRRQGLGLGDVKLVSAAGLWIGWQGVPLLLS